MRDLIHPSPPPPSPQYLPVMMRAAVDFVIFCRVVKTLALEKYNGKAARLERNRIGI